MLETRRGRCGEYSILMLLFLQVLGYEARWIVDREDHVWAEVNISDWIHVDPCEAVVNEPLIYQSWGKLQTFIFAFSSKNGYCDIEDVTLRYTTNATSVSERRLMEGVNQSQVDLELTKLTNQHMNFK